jgi:hypothetical protein
MQYTITVDQVGLAAIGEGLGKLPYERAAPLIASVQQQINQQETAAREAAKRSGAAGAAEAVARAADGVVADARAAQAGGTKRTRRKAQ